MVLADFKVIGVVADVAYVFKGGGLEDSHADGVDFRAGEIVLREGSDGLESAEELRRHVVLEELLVDDLRESG